MSKAEQEQRRRALVPEIRYPDDLPVSQRREDIAAAIRDHQVVIVAGETGSGKTTQLPKICLDLGCLRQLLPRRPDLKVVITSATIDPERFSRHFAGADGVGAPIVEVSGRTYPVEVRYRPLVEESYDDEEGEPVVRDQTEAIEQA